MKYYFCVLFFAALIITSGCGKQYRSEFCKTKEIKQQNIINLDKDYEVRICKDKYEQINITIEKKDNFVEFEENRPTSVQCFPVVRII